MVTVAAQQRRRLLIESPSRLQPAFIDNADARHGSEGRRALFRANSERFPWHRTRGVHRALPIRSHPWGPSPLGCISCREPIGRQRGESRCNDASEAPHARPSDLHHHERKGPLLYADISPPRALQSSETGDNPHPRGRDHLSEGQRGHHVGPGFQSPRRPHGRVVALQQVTVIWDPLRGDASSGSQTQVPRSEGTFPRFGHGLRAGHSHRGSHAPASSPCASAVARISGRWRRARSSRWQACVGASCRVASAPHPRADTVGITSRDSGVRGRWCCEWLSRKALARTVGRWT